MSSKPSRPSAHGELDRTKEELARSHRRSHLLEQRLKNNQQVFVDFESIALAVGHLIETHTSDQAILESFALLGGHIGLDRIYLLKNQPFASKNVVIDQSHAWVREPHRFNIPHFSKLPWEAFFPDWVGRFEAGEAVSGNIEEAPAIERLTLVKNKVVSYLWIPIHFDGQWWGVLGFDQVSSLRNWHPKEVSGYRLLANSVVEFLNRQRLETDLRLFQERHEMASEAGQFGVWDWDILTNQVYLDRSIKHMGGYLRRDTAEEPLNWESLFVLHDDSDWVEAISKRVTNREKVFELEHKMRHSSGRYVDVYSRGKVIYNDSGSAVRVLGTTTDITHLKAIQNDLRKARDMAEEGSLTKSGFMAKMSHEIRTPLNGVLGFATLLKHTELNSEQADYVSNLETSGRLLLSMVNNILDFSKIEAGKLDLELKPFDIRGSVDTILGVFGDAVIRKGLKIAFEAADDVPHSVITDPLRIQQVILNLVGNAVKFTESGSVDVEAVWKALGYDAGKLHFSVRDTGIGIDTDRLEAIFEPFTQADSSMTRRYGGSGLGLSICQSILQAMGSELKVSSEVGKGSEFSFEIQVKECPAEVIEKMEIVRDSRKPVTSESKPSAKLEQRAKARILLAEDNALNQQVISKLLGRLGYNAVLVENGQEAVDALKRWEFDLVFMDLMMPVLDGVSATKVIRETLPPAKQPVIIALTANSSEDDITNCMAIGMNDFISKPVELQMLEKTLADHLKLSTHELEPEFRVPTEATIDFPESQTSDLLDIEMDDLDERVFEHFDPEFMRNLLGSNSEPEVQDEFSIDAIEIFLETTSYIPALLKNHAKEEKWKEFEREAHSMKGTAKTVGALILGNLALQLELWVRGGHVGDRYNEMDELAVEYRMLAKELERYANQLKEKQRHLS